MFERSRVLKSRYRLRTSGVRYFRATRLKLESRFKQSSGVRSLVDFSKPSVAIEILSSSK